MSTLAAHHCVPCEAGTPPMSIKEARALLPEVPGWSLDEQEPKLMRRFRFKNFMEALTFVNRVGALAEAEGHHPDIIISWNRVRLDLTTHAIKGLSSNDFIMAAHINELPGAQPPPPTD